MMLIMIPHKHEHDESALKGERDNDEHIGISGRTRTTTRSLNFNP